MGSAHNYEAILVSLPTVESLNTALDSATGAPRELVFIKVTDDVGRVGWGECSALNSPGYTTEWARGAFGLLTSGTPIDPSVHPMAHAGVEMAQLDLELKTQGLSLAAHLGATKSNVPAGVVVGLQPVEELLAKVDALSEAGYRRVKLKVAPGEIVERVIGVRDRHRELEIQIDANGSLTASDLVDLAALGEVGVAVVEQPFAPDDALLNGKLREQLGVPVFADEAIRTQSDLLNRPNYDGLVVKPGPSGGIGRTTELVSAALDRNLLLSVGGMLESGLGRHGLAAVAATDAFTHTGDISPARRWLKHDPWPDLTMVDGYITTPTSPGVTPDPDHELLERFSVARGQVLRR